MATPPLTVATEAGVDIVERWRQLDAQHPLKRACEYALQVAPAQAERGRPDSLQVARVLWSLNVDEATLIAGLLSTPALETELDETRLDAEFGDTVARLVRSVRFLNAFKDGASVSLHGPEQAERVRRMVLAVVQDVRAVLIKLAWRLERLRMLPRATVDERRAIARETLDIYTPLANRLGIGQLKWEMEDLAFRYLEPIAYKTIAKALEERRDARELFIHAFINELTELLAQESIPVISINGRPKHIFSIWKKMQSKQVSFNDLFDVRAVRVMVDSVRDCYSVLGVVHGHWPHVPREFDDYIANPKPNGYQSLHTAVLGSNNKPIEVQIRTREMHEFAEHGFAAHWRYKEGSTQDNRLQNTINALRGLLDAGHAEDTLLDSFQTELFSDRVFVFTPKGQLFDLLQGATPLDFAYAVHTSVGHRCRGAKVNGRIVNLRHTLHNGDQVEILTGNEPRPSRDWLNAELGFIKSPRARAKVRAWYNLKDQTLHQEEGRHILERELRRLRAGDIDHEKLTRQLKFDRQSDMIAAIGRAEINSAQIAGAVQALLAPGRPVVRPAPESADRERGNVDGVRVRGVGDLLTQSAGCCLPVPNDDIVGFITRGKGVTVHRSDCQNILNLRDEEKQRLIEVSWGEEEADVFTACIRVLAYDRQALLRDISDVLAKDRINVLAVNSISDRKEQTAEFKVTVEIGDIAQLASIMNQIAQLANVIEVERIE